MRVEADLLTDEFARKAKNELKLQRQYLKEEDQLFLDLGRSLYRTQYHEYYRQFGEKTFVRYVTNMLGMMPGRAVHLANLAKNRNLLKKAIKTQDIVTMGPTKFYVLIQYLDKNPLTEKLGTYICNGQVDLEDAINTATAPETTVVGLRNFLFGEDKVHKTMEMLGWQADLLSETIRSVQIDSKTNLTESDCLAKICDYYISNKKTKKIKKR